MNKEIMRSIIGHVNAAPVKERPTRVMEVVLCILDNADLSQIEISGIIHCLHIETDREFILTPQIDTGDTLPPPGEN